jgi:uncharacterized membrane protein
MRALERLPPAPAVATMQTINVVIVNPCFMSAFFGTAGACAVIGAEAILQWRAAEPWLALTGCVLYLLGAVLVTMLLHVPMNQTLAGVPPDGGLATRLWAAWVPTWTFCNPVRTLAALGAAAMLMTGLAASTSVGPGAGLPLRP